MKRPPTDFELLHEIYKRHRVDFARDLAGVTSDPETAPVRASKILVPIDIPAIAERLDADPDSIFGRLYYHLEPKHGEPKKDRQPRKVFFAPVAGTDRNCVNFPLLEAVLASLWQERRRDRFALTTATLSIGIAFSALLVSILVR